MLNYFKNIKPLFKKDTVVKKSCQINLFMTIKKSLHIKKIFNSIFIG